MPIHWPAIIKHADDPELTYIGDASAWERDPELQQFVYEDADLLIDSRGRLYSLTHRELDLAVPKAIGEVMPLETVLGLVKAHASQAGSCCVAKLYAPTIAEAFDMLRSLESK